MQLQQGDVMLEKVTEIPREAEKQSHLTFAKGEKTGHHHTASIGALFLLGEQMFFENSEVATLRHQEHGPITIQPGKWKVGIVREYDPFDEEARRVAD